MSSALRSHANQFHQRHLRALRADAGQGRTAPLDRDQGPALLDRAQRAHQRLPPCGSEQGGDPAGIREGGGAAIGVLVFVRLHLCDPVADARFAEDRSLNIKVGARGSPPSLRRMFFTTVRSVASPRRALSRGVPGRFLSRGARGSPRPPKRRSRRRLHPGSGPPAPARTSGSKLGRPVRPDPRGASG